MAACLAPVMQATIFVISTAPYLQHVLYGSMFSTCHAGHRIGHQARHHVCYTCHSWHSLYYLSSMASCLSSSLTPCLLPVKQSTLSITCQSFTCSSMALCSPTVKHGTICSSLEHSTMYVTYSRMTPRLPPVQLGTLVFFLSSMAPCVPLLGWALWSSICQAWRHVYSTPC
jgi:hypothetical protein